LFTYFLIFLRLFRSTVSLEEREFMGCFAALAAVGLVEMQQEAFAVLVWE
jgi:hypothetical protein